MSNQPNTTQAAAEIEALESAKRRCENARWSEHHDPRCAWCAFLAGGVQL